MRITKRIVNDILLIIFISFLGIFIIWLPFLSGFKEGTLTLFKNYDGPNYIIVAKSWYNKELIAKKFSNPLPLEYYPAHFPGYPLTIFLLDKFLPGPWAMLLSSLIFTVFTTVIFYLFLWKFNLSKNPLWLAIIFSFFPARWMAVKAVGSAEPLFLFGIITSFYFFKSAFDKVENNLLSRRKNIYLDLFLAGFFGAIAQVTKSPGILLFIGYISYLFYLCYKKEKKIGEAIKQCFPLFLIPFSVLAVFSFYKIKTGDFWAYFHSGDNFHLFFPPYQGFIPEKSWLGNFWNEDMIWQYLVGALTVVSLFRQKRFDLGFFAGIFFLATLFVAHRDLARYSIPLIPFSLIAFDNFLQSKEFKLALLIILPAVYLFTIYFIGGNIAPIADWAPFL